jgi:hypothetical protein
MKASEIQKLILTETGIKTSVKQGTGSMKNYLIFSPMFQNGIYPEFPFQWRREKGQAHPGAEPYPNFWGSTQIHIYNIENDFKSFKKERKPKEKEYQKVKQWGSKNSQIRLDKAVKRNAKNMKKGNTARYY